MAKISALSNWINKSTNSTELFMKASEKKTYGDNCWKLDAPKKADETSTALIRLLPSLNEGEAPFVTFYSHLFTGDNGRVFGVDRCPRTFGEECPVCKRVNEMFNTKDEAMVSAATRRKGRLNYAYNILVINDKQHPENNGKVFVWKCGKQVQEKIADALKDNDFGVAMNPFDLMKGNNLILRLSKKGKDIADYANSQFDTNVTPAANSEEEFEAILNAMTDLNVFKNSNRRPVEEIEARAMEAFASHPTSLDMAYMSTARPSGAVYEAPAPVQVAPTPKPKAKKEVPVEADPFDASMVETTTTAISGKSDEAFFDDIVNSL